MFFLVHGKIILDFLIIAFYYTYELVSRIESGSLARGSNPFASFVIDKGIKLAKYTGWAADLLERVNSTLKKSFFRLDTKVLQLSIVRCPAHHFCLIESKFDKEWYLKVTPYPTSLDHYPSQLSRQIEQATYQGIYFLVVRGPISGMLSFSAILYHQQYSLASPQPIGFNRSNPCPVTLGSGAPDGILTFLPGNH
ncbi:hypothetical protein DSO57_1028557 [Entomophthora muscae]|uniref:Uncharacterized protein n=1 Tax=Entomophthora muscae TaxID=34485 RepID=A0ACC2UAV2_9FUNG|nr:hypothetical protein DSO57_1028557 [Entomophthora muscae]